MLNIRTGLNLTPPKVVIYGPEGIGKTTLAGKFPGALFVDLENGSGRLDVARVETPVDYAAFKILLKEIMKEPPENYHTLIVDTADKLDGMITQDVIDNAVDKKKDIDSIEDFGYGKGYTYIEETWRKLLDALSSFQRKTGWTVIFIGHAMQRKIETVGQAGNYDHYELKLSKKASPLLKEWADFLLFINYDVTLVKDKDNNKTKAVGGERVIYTNHSTYYDAKSRAPLPDSLELDAEGIKTIFRAIYPEGNPLKKAAPAAEPAPASAPEPQPEVTPEDRIHETEVGCNIPPKVEEPPSNSPADLGVKKDEPAVDPKIQDYIKRIDNALTIDGYTRADLELVTVKMGMRPAGTPLESFSEQDLTRIVNNWEKVIRNIKKLKE